VSTDPPPPPVVPESAYTHVEHDLERPDPYHWMRDREDPRLMEHLQAENRHTAAVMALAGELPKQLFQELIGRIEESTVSAPWGQGDWVYRSRIEAGQQYARYERKPRDRDEAWAVFFNANVEAGQSAYFDLGFLDISPDGHLLAYAVDDTGDETYTIRFRDLKTGLDLPDRLEDVSAMGEWAATNQHYFFLREDDARRPYRLYLHTIGKDIPAKLLYEESDPLFYLGLEKSQDLRYVFAVSESQETSEVQYLPADLQTDSFTALFGRREGHQYSVEHREANWLVRTNLDAPDYKLLSLPVGSTDLTTADLLIGPQDGSRLEGILPLRDHIVLFERVDGLDRVRVLDPANHSLQTLPTTDPVYEMDPGPNLEFNAEYLDIEYSSPIRPAQVVRHHLASGTSEILKKQKVPSGHDPEAYRVERIRLPSHDGIAIPMTLVHLADLPADQPHPVYMYGYGAYGSPVETSFRSSWLTWLNRGFIVAIPHVRGGGLLGEAWYQDGKLGNKANSFKDCIACAEFLVCSGRTSPGRIALHGASAGGLLVGAVLNTRPDLFGAIVAEVPFVDVLNTMLDPSLPLTEFEYEEWGNPQEPEAFATIRAYAPYENVRPQPYPALLATAGLNDPRVPYWEAAKWVARLRQNQTGTAPLLLKVDLDSGHGGPSGRYRAWEEIAFVQAFILHHLGIEAGQPSP
jgi:oligopeptidase B